MAMSKFSFFTPQEPPWPEQRSITAISVWGNSRSISAAFGPMFCARAWQARCTATPPGERLQAGGEALLLGDVDQIFAGVECRAREPLHVLVLGQEQAAIRI